MGRRGLSDRRTRPHPAFLSRWLLLEIVQHDTRDPDRERGKRRSQGGGWGEGLSQASRNGTHKGMIGRTTGQRGNGFPLPLPPPKKKPLGSDAHHAIGKSQGRHAPLGAGLFSPVRPPSPHFFRIPGDGCGTLGGEPIDASPPPPPYPSTPRSCSNAEGGRPSRIPP